MKNHHRTMDCTYYETRCDINKIQPGNKAALRGEYRKMFIKKEERYRKLKKFAMNLFSNFHLTLFAASLKKCYT